MDQIHPDHSEVYAALLEALPVAAPPAHLAELERDWTAVRRFPTNCSALCAMLGKRFTAERLCQAGICLRGDDGKARLRPQFRAGQGMCIGLADADGRPFDILTEAGCVSGQLPLLQCLQDATFQRHEANSTNLYVAFSIRDLAALRMLGLPAALACGLEGLRRQLLQQVRRAFGWQDENDEAALADDDDEADVADKEAGVPSAEPSGEADEPVSIRLPREPQSPPPPPPPTEPTAAEGPAPQSPQPAQPPCGTGRPPADLNLVLVGWSPWDWACSEPAQLSSVAGHLRRLRQDLDISLQPTSIWAPAQDTLSRIEFLLDHVELPQVRESIDQIVGRTARKLIEPQPLSFAETILRHLRPGQWHSAEQDWAAARTAVFRLCVEPLLAELEQPQVSPLERSRKLILFHRLWELHRRLLPKPQRGANQAEAQRKEIQQAANEMLALIDALEPRDQPASRPRRKRYR